MIKAAIAIILVSFLILVGGAWWSTRESNDPDVISTRGLHWHPELTIYVKGAKQEIPTNIGMGGVEMPIHTHDSTGVIHLEIGGLVRKEDILLGRFFKIWDKDMRSFGSNMKMTVNGEENTDYETYAMKDKDKIELLFD